MYTPQVHPHMHMLTQVLVYHRRIFIVQLCRHNMYMHLCLDICIYIYKHICICIYIYMNICMYIHIYKYTCTHNHLSICVYIYICTYTGLHACVSIFNPRGLRPLQRLQAQLVVTAASAALASGAAPKATLGPGAMRGRSQNSLPKGFR